MSIVKIGASALGKLLVIVALAGAFLLGLVGVIFLSLRSEEVKVPEVVGKDYNESEKELAANGLRIKKRATRYSQEKPNTILEQSPKAGETAKSGQLILVVVSQANPEGTEAPAVVDKQTSNDNTDDSTDDNADNPDKTKKSKVKKPAQTTRDGSANKADKTADTKTDTTGKPSNTANSGANSKDMSPSRKPSSNTVEPPKLTPDGIKSGETRSRRVPN